MLHSKMIFALVALFCAISVALTHSVQIRTSVAKPHGLMTPPDSALEDKEFRDALLEGAERLTRDTLKEVERSVMTEFRKQILGNTYNDGQETAAAPQISYLEHREKFFSDLWEKAKSVGKKVYKKGKKAAKHLWGKAKEHGTELFGSLVDEAREKGEALVQSLAGQLREELPPKLQGVMETVVDALLKKEAIDEAAEKVDDVMQTE